jgi:hypothetical protein
MDFPGWSLNTDYHYKYVSFQVDFSEKNEIELAPTDGDSPEQRPEH